MCALVHLLKTRSPSGPVPPHERHFYSQTDAFGRFGMRIFKPQIMDRPHWHGHIEANFFQDTTASYIVDGTRVGIPPNCLVLFWAGIPHRMTDVQPLGQNAAQQCNIYLPVDSFLFMTHIAPLQIALLSGAMIRLPGDICNRDLIDRWYADYRTGDVEGSEIIKMEINVLLRRALYQGLEFIRPPLGNAAQDRDLSSANMRHVVQMIRHVMEHLEQPLTNADVTAVTGLHTNYALTLFTRTMHIPLKKFIIRMRLIRARSMLLESDLPATTIGPECGFASTSQFYHHFQQAYGASPNEIRKQYLEAMSR